MLIKALTGKLTLGAFLFVVALAALRYGIQSHTQSEQRAQAWNEKNAPAISAMLTKLLTTYDWRYTGPLGERKLHFNSDGTVDVREGETVTQGTWSATGPLLSLELPGSDSPLHGMFKTTMDTLQGTDSSGTVTGSWSAQKIAD